MILSTEINEKTTQACQTSISAVELPFILLEAPRLRIIDEITEDTRVEGNEEVNEEESEGRDEDDNEEDANQETPQLEASDETPRFAEIERDQD